MKYENVYIENPKLLNIDSDILKQKIEELKVEKEKIDKVFDNFTEDMSHFFEWWSGDTGDMINEELARYIKSFEIKRRELKDRIDFLQNVANSYEAFDKYIANQTGFYV